jgi:hypothetical protein
MLAEMQVKRVWAIHHQVLLPPSTSCIYTPLSGVYITKWIKLGGDKRSTQSDNDLARIRTGSAPMQICGTCYKAGRCDPFTTRSYTTYSILGYRVSHCFKIPVRERKKIWQKKAHPNVPWPGLDLNRGHPPYPDGKWCKESGCEPFTTRSYSFLLQAVFIPHFSVST